MADSFCLIPLETEDQFTQQPNNEAGLIKLPDQASKHTP